LLFAFGYEQLKAPKGQRATNSLYPPPLEEGKPLRSERGF